MLLSADCRSKNAPQFLIDARDSRGSPIEIVADREESRLIYFGVAHSRPRVRGRMRKLERVGDPAAIQNCAQAPCGVIFQGGLRRTFRHLQKIGGDYGADHGMCSVIAHAIR